MATEINNTSGGPTAQNVAARSHTSELTHGRFCFRVSTGGRHRWAAWDQVGREPARQKAQEGYPSQYTSLIPGKKLLYFAFVGLEKAFDRAPRKVLWWALRSLGVEGWAVRVIQGMYSNARSCDSSNGQYSEEFGMRVGVHQDSVPLLFILVLEALLREFCTGVLWELLYTDDLVLNADTQEECISQLKAWKAGMESKGLHVNMKKTKFLFSGEGQDVLQKSGKYSCAVCSSGVGRNSILCSHCMLWGHKTCSGITKWLFEDPNYICPRSKGEFWPIDGRTVTEVDVDGTMLDVEATFYYLGDMLCSGGDCDSATAARCCVAWGKFRKLLPILTTKYVARCARPLFTQLCSAAA